MWKRFIAAPALALFAGAVAAQQPVNPKPPQQPAAKPIQTVAQHALFGTIKALDLKASTLIVMPQQGAEVTFRVDPQSTHVRGMEGAATLAALAAKTGSGIVVHYTGEAPGMKAVGIDFIGTELVKVADGTLIRVHKATRSIVIKGPTGTEETFELVGGAPIELATGLVTFELFATKLNERVSLYYTEKAGAKRVRLIKATAPSAS